MSKMAFITKKELNRGFSALGAVVFLESQIGQNGELLDRLAEEGMRIIFVSEKIAKLHMQKIDAYNQSTKINIVILPEENSSSSLTMDKIAEISKNVIGAQIVGRG